MMTTRESIKFVSAALDEDKEKNIVLRGVIEANSLSLLKVGPYQREILPLSKIKDLEEAFTEGSAVPDIDLGMRGGNFTEMNGAFYLQDETYIIDGLQRVTAAKKTIESGKVVPRLGGIVHFNTTEEWERNRFRILNTLHTKLSPNIMIRNMEKEYNIVELLHTLTKDKSFVLAEKVCWNQRMLRSSELISAFTFLKVASALHSKFGAVRPGGSYREIIPSMEKLYVKLGRGTIRENIKTYWNVLDECFNIRFTVYKEMAPHLKASFLLAIANIFSDHAVFWKDAILFVPSILRKKIAQFPVLDPQIVQLSGTSGGVGSQMLYELILKHINKGKTTKRLSPSRRSIKVSQEIVE